MKASKKSLSPKLKRRLWTFPALILLCLVAIVSAPLCLFLAIAADIFSSKSWPRLRAFLSIWWILLCEILGVAFATLLWCWYLLHRDSQRFLRHNWRIQRTWTSALFWGAKNIHSLKIEIEGLETLESGPSLFLVRHVSVVDTVVAAALIGNPRKLRLRYVVKEELLFDPCLDLVGMRLPNVFVRRGARRQDDVDALSEIATGMREDEGVLIFPEGTRYTPRKAANSGERLRENSERARLIKLRNLLPPKRAGTLKLLESHEIRQVVVVSHCGLDSLGTLNDLWRGSLIGKKLKLRIQSFAIDAIPNDNAERYRWLVTQWCEMDKWLQDQQVAS